MAGQIIQNGNLRLRIAHALDIDAAASVFNNAGKTPMQAGAMYGTRQPTLREASPFFLKDSLWKKNNEILQLARPMTTSTGVILLNAPLAETIQTEGQEKYIAYSKTHNILNIKTVRIPITDTFISALNSKGMKMEDNGLILFEQNYTVDWDGWHQYRISIKNPNESLRVAYVNSIPQCGWAETGQHPILFGQGGESLKVYLNFCGEPMNIGFAACGYGVYRGAGKFYDWRYVVIGDKLDSRSAVLVKEQAPDGVSIGKSENVVKQERD